MFPPAPSFLFRMFTIPLIHNRDTRSFSLSCHSEATLSRVGLCSGCRHCADQSFRLAALASPDTFVVRAPAPPSPPDTLLVPSMDASSSSSGSRGSSRRRGSTHSGSRPSRGGGIPIPIGGAHFGGGKHGGGLVGGGGNGLMGMPMGMGMGPMGMGPMGMGPMGMMGMGGAMGIGGGKDYAAMASMSSPGGGGGGVNNGFQSSARGGRYMPGAAVHASVAIARPMAGAAAASAGKDYASLAGGLPSASSAARGSGTGGGGIDRRGGGASYADQARDVRSASRGGSGGGGGRFDRAGGGGSKAPPSPAGRDQFGRERDWRSSSASNGRRQGASPPNGQPPPVVHGSGFGTFSMALANSGGGGASVVSSSKLSGRDNRSPGRGGGVGLTRADLVREHSRQRQRQEKEKSSAPSSSQQVSQVKSIQVESVRHQSVWSGCLVCLLPRSGP